MIPAAIIFPRLTVDDSLQKWVPESSPIIADYQFFLNLFRSDSFLLLSLVDKPETGTGPISEHVKTLMTDIGALPHVSRVVRWPPPFLRLKTRQDRNVHSLLVSFTPPSRLNPNRPELIGQITSRLEKTGLEFHLAGTGVIHEAINEGTKRVSGKFLAIGLTILFGLLLALTGNPLTVLKTIGVALGGVATLILTAYASKISFTMVMAILPILILFYGTSASVHALNQQGDFKRVFWPTFIAVLTTCAGFLVFLPGSIPVLRDFGLLAVAGLAGVMLWLCLFNFPPSRCSPLPLRLGGVLNLLNKLWAPGSMILSGILMILLVPGALRVKTEINSLSNIPRDHQSFRDYLYTAEHVGSTMPVEYIVDTERADRRGVTRWIEAVMRLEEVGGVMSYTAIPSFLDPRDMDYLSRDGRFGRVTFFIPLMTTTAGLKLVNHINRLAAEQWPASSHVASPTGFACLYVSIADDLSRSFLASLIEAFLLVFLIIFIFLRNLKLLFASILSNIFPLAAMLGLMGWAQIPLDMVTVPIGCLVLGTAVDNTCHVLHWYKKKGEAGAAFREAGPGMIINALILSIGFAVFLFAPVPPVRYFGLLGLTGVITALFGDAVILGGIMKWLDRRGRHREDGVRS
jgi:hypothetical protein